MCSSDLAPGPALVLLSARSEDRLRESARRLHEAIGCEGWGDERLADLAYTLQVGREAMDERLALLASSMAELRRKLAAWLAGEEGVEALYRGRARPRDGASPLFAADEELQQAVSQWVARGKFGHVLELWVQGLAFDWQRLHDLAVDVCQAIISPAMAERETLVVHPHEM